MSKNLTKVLLFSPVPPPIGGITVWTTHILNYYYSIKNKSNVELIHVSSSKGFGRITNRNPLYVIGTGILGSLFILNKLKNNIKRSKPDLIHFTTSGSLSLIKDYFIQYIAKSNNVGTILHLHFGTIPKLVEKRNWEWKMLTKVIERSSRTIVLDEKSYNTLVNEGFSNIEILPNPISPKILNLIEVNEVYNLRREKRKIIFVGHVILTKGVYELVKACVDIPNLNLELIGPYEISVKNDLFSIAKERENGGWLIMSGMKDMSYVIQSMINASIFCLPTYSEGFPNVILESMACSCPIIATSVGAIPEMLNVLDSENRCGTCIEPKDVFGLRESINMYLNDEKLARSHGDAARKRVISEYNVSAVWNKMRSIWDESY